MKTHINQILTVVSFFSMSLTTTLAISWGMNGFMIDETKANTKVQCPDQQSIEVHATNSQQREIFNLKISNGLKVFIPKINLKTNG